jgi:hypothetical protein
MGMANVYNPLLRRTWVIRRGEDRLWRGYQEGRLAVTSSYWTIVVWYATGEPKYRPNLRWTS